MGDHYEDRYRNDPYRGERGYGREDRGFTERAGDEVRSWFGDEEAQRRRHLDEQERERQHNRVRDVDRPRNRDYGLGRERDLTDRYPGQTPSEERWRPREGATPDTWSGSSAVRYGAQQDYEGWRPRNLAGRGPKNYQRSDARIMEDVCDRLTEAPDVDASDIEVTVKSGEVTLTGMVTDRSEKRRSEDLIESVGGVREVHNHLRIGRQHESTLGTTLTTGTTASTVKR